MERGAGGGERPEIVLGFRKKENMRILRFIEPFMATRWYYFHRYKTI